MRKKNFIIPLILLCFPLFSEMMIIETTTQTHEFDISEIENIEFTGITDVESLEIMNQINFKLNQNFPNPFNPNTKISFALKSNGEVNLEIFNLKGQKIKTLVDRSLNEGDHTINWNGTDETNRKVSSGMYFYKLTFDGQTNSKKMIMLK